MKTFLLALNLTGYTLSLESLPGWCAVLGFIALGVEAALWVERG